MSDLQQQGHNGLCRKRMVLDVLECSQTIIFFCLIFQELEHLLGQSVNFGVIPHVSGSTFLSYSALSFSFGLFSFHSTIYLS